MVIGIAGGSGSGKTTFAKRLLAIIGEERATILEQDAYYKDQSIAYSRNKLAVNFDHPDVLDFGLMTEHLRDLKAWQTIERPIYDFVTRTRSKGTVTLSPRPVIVVEGILIFHPPVLFKEFDMSFFMEVPEDIRLKRRIQRDVRERGRTAEEVLEVFLRQVKPMHDQFVEPTKALASYVIKSY